MMSEFEKEKMVGIVKGLDDEETKSMLECISTNILLDVIKERFNTLEKGIDNLINVMNESGWIK